MQNRTENAAIDNRIREIKEQGGSNIRKNQAQVDANGNKVGNNRPDIQYDMDGVHHTEEFDYNPANSQRHYETIKQNDPSTEINLNIIE